jgi:tRNA A-37 threonylcarbamoyl transferase component Bud32
MIFPPHRRIRIVRLAPDGADRSEWTSTLSARDWGVGAEILKKSDDASVVRAMVHSRDVVLKSRVLRGLKPRVQGMLGRSRSHRQWNGSEWLRSQGLQSPRCLLAAVGERDGQTVETLVLEYAPGHTLLWQIARGVIMEGPDSPASRAIAYTLGRDLAIMIKAGRFNRDHKPSNIVVTTPGPPAAALSIVDAVAIVPFKPARRSEAMARMIASLLIEPRGIGHPVPESFIHRTVLSLAHEMVGATEAEAWTRDMLAWAQRIVAAHKDPVPTHDPLIGLH